MITPEFLQACTPEQINKGVEWLKIKLEFKINRMNTLQFLLCNSRLITPRPYCTNPNDAWPIIESNKIAIDWLRCGGTVALSSDWLEIGLERRGENPFRAAMEVYLLMSNDK